MDKPTSGQPVPPAKPMEARYLNLLKQLIEAGGPAVISQSHHAETSVSGLLRAGYVASEHGERAHDIGAPGGSQVYGWVLTITQLGRRAYRARSWIKASGKKGTAGTKK